MKIWTASSSLCHFPICLSFLLYMLKLITRMIFYYWEYLFNNLSFISSFLTHPRVLVIVPVCLQSELCIILTPRFCPLDLVLLCIALWGHLTWRKWFTMQNSGLYESSSKINNTNYYQSLLTLQKIMFILSNRLGNLWIHGWFYKLFKFL